MMKHLLVIMALHLSITPALAQDNGLRPMPGPPAVGEPGDFEDMDDDLMEIEDPATFRPPPPPPPPGTAGFGEPPASMQDRPNAPQPAYNGGGGSAPGSGKPIKFKIVENEFWEKGKKRTRGTK